MNISSTRARQAPAPKPQVSQAPPKEQAPKETFTSRTSDVFEEIVPIYSSVSVGLGGLEVGQSVGGALAGDVGRVVGGAVGLVGGLFGGDYIGREAVGFYGDIGAGLDTNNPARGKAVAQALTAGLFGAAFGGAGSAAVLVGAGVGMAGLETAWANYKSS